jgi:hypothetical protein
MINRLFVVLVISLCIFSLSFHFIVEGLGESMTTSCWRQHLEFSPHDGTSLC